MLKKRLFQIIYNDHTRFNLSFATNAFCHQSSSFLCQVITTSTSSAFSTAFITESSFPTESTIVNPIRPDGLLNYFNHVCSEILDNVAPFKMRCHKVKNQTWLNDVTLNMRRVCRQA